MIDLSSFYSAKMAVVFILMLSSATLEAQRNENDEFFEFMTTIGEHFGGEFNDAEKALELDLIGANAFLERLHRFATSEIIRKNKNGQFECIDRNESTKSDFKMAIKTILGEDMINLVRVIPKNVDKKAYALLSTVLDKTLKPNKKVEDWQSLLKELSVKFSEKKLFNLLFSLAARLEALVHGKNIDGTLKEKQKNPKDKIQTFLAVPKCFILPESELRIFDYWIEIIETKTKKSQKPIYGVAIYKEKYDKYKSDSSEEEAFKLSKENYEILRQLNDQKFSIYESSNLLREAFNRAYTTYNYGDEETNRRLAAQLGKQKHILGGKIPQIFMNLLIQIELVFFFNWKRNEYLDKNKKCEYAMFFQNISESLMKMMSDKGIDPKLQLHSEDKKIREKVKKDVEECKKFDNEESKIIFLNNVHYELAINFEFNQRKDVYDRVEDLLSDWVGGYSLIHIYGIKPLSEESYLKENASQMLRKIKHFTSEKTNRKTISIIEGLIGKEFNLGALFDQIKTLVEVTIPEEEANLEKAKAEINKKQLENEIQFLKNNPKSIAEEKYQKAVAIICTIKEYGEKVKMLKSKIKTTKIQKILNELFSTIQNNETKYFGPKFLEQMEEFCNQLKPKQIEMEENEIVSEKILLKDLEFEFDEIWNRLRGVWEGFEEYYLEIPLMQLTEQARTLAKAFGKMLINVKEHYAPKMDESNDGEDMIISE